MGVILPSSPFSAYYPYNRVKKNIGKDFFPRSRKIITPNKKPYL